MRRRRISKAHARLLIAFRSRKQVNAIIGALKPELLHTTGGKAQAKIITRGRVLELAFKSRDTTTLRAIFSSYLRLLSASIDTCNALIQLEKVGAKERDKT